MSIYDYLGGPGDNKQFHTYGFADNARARQMGADGFRSFKERRRRENNRRVIRGYTDSRIVKVPEAKRELAVAQREDTKQRFEKLQARREEDNSSRLAAQRRSNQPK